MTDRQRQVYRIMVEHVAATGAPPTLREIAEKLGVHRTTAHSHVLALQRQGHVEARKVIRELTETRYFPVDLADAA